VESRCYEIAKQLLLASVEYHRQQNRQLHMHKVRIAGALLDEAVANAQQVICDESVCGRGPVERWRSLGPVMRFATRSFDEFGFPSAARYDDYSRWMQAPVA
jgi:hypothetical protein